MGDRRLTTAQVAARLNAKLSTVTLWCRQGRFPGAQRFSEGNRALWLIP